MGANFFCRYIQHLMLYGPQVYIISSHMFIDVSLQEAFKIILHDLSILIRSRDIAKKLVNFHQGSKMRFLSFFAYMS